MTAHASDGKADQTFSHQLRRWAQTNDWYPVDGAPNQLKLDMKFGSQIMAVACQLDTLGRDRHRRRLLDCWDHLLGKCLQVDQIWRAGYRRQEDLDELEFLRIKAEVAVMELAGVIHYIQNGRACFIRYEGTPPEEEWITFIQAAEILAVSKGTVSKWVAAGRLKDNGLTGKKRRLSKVNVLLVKQQEEDREARKDLKDFRDDARRFK